MTRDEEALCAALSRADVLARAVNIFYLDKADSINIEVESEHEYVGKNVTLDVLRAAFPGRRVEAGITSKTCGCETCNYGAVYTSEFNVT
jgi:hypothetical protein